MNKTNNNSNPGLESKLWAAVDKMRGHMDPAEYKHVLLGLIFLKYISDAFQTKYEQLVAIQKTDPYRDPEDRDEYSADNIFWVPKEARWAKIQDGAKQPDIEGIVDGAMEAIEKENPKLKEVLPQGLCSHSTELSLGWPHRYHQWNWVWKR